MAEVPPLHHEDTVATAQRARAMREDARSARERNRQLLRANEELRARLRARQAAAVEPDTGR